MPKPERPQPERTWDEILRDIQRAWADTYLTDRQVELSYVPPPQSALSEETPVRRPAGC